MVLCWQHTVIIPKRFHIYCFCAFIQQCKTKLSSKICRNLLIKKYPQMRPSSRTGTLCQSINPLFFADCPNRIHFLFPFIIGIGEVLFLCSVFMVIKIKYDKAAGVVGQERVHPNHVRSILPFPFQMLHNLCNTQFTITLIFALTTLYFYPVCLWADTIMPEVITLREIACFPALFIYTPFRINIFPTPKPCKEVPCSIFRYCKWQNPFPLV